MRNFAITLICTAAFHTMAQVPASSVSIQVDLAKSEGVYKPIYNWFGYDESNFTTMKYGRQLLTELHDLSPVPVYVRAHHLFTSGDGVPDLKWSSSNVFTLDPAGKPVYDFAILDTIFDEYRDAGVRPMVELGFMPEALASGKGPYRLPYPKTVSGSVQSPPKDFAQWGELVRRFTEHLVERYGKTAVSTWYFEVWNEPDIGYWQGTQEQYLKLYDYSVAAVRNALPTAKVGGPATTGRGMTLLEAFLKHCANDKNAATGQPIPLDFISFHPKGRPSVVDGHVRMGLSNELSAAADNFRVIAASAKYRNTPIVLSEADPEGCAACSAHDNPSNNYRNGPLYPVYTAVAMKGLIDLAAQYKVNLIAMLTWSFEFEDKQYFEGFRTLATNGVDKPILNLFRMAGLMAGTRVSTTSSGQLPLETITMTGVHDAPDIDAFATKSSHGMAVMLWNYHDDDVTAGVEPVQLEINNIPTGVKKVLLQHYRIDYTHSNAYTTWKAMGSPKNPTVDQYTKLQAAGQLELLGSPQWLDVKGDRVTIGTDLPRQATSLIRLEW